MLTSRNKMMEKSVYIHLLKLLWRLKCIIKILLLRLWKNASFRHEMLSIIFKRKIKNFEEKLVSKKQGYFTFTESICLLKFYSY